MRKLFILFSLLGTHFFANAVVDMKNANFSDTWVDLIVPGSGYDLRVTRFYNSRSLFNGLFGFGWCSDFETKIEILPEGAIKLQECGAGQEIIYQSADYSAKNLEASIQKIIAAEKKINASQKPGYWKQRAQRLRDSWDLRESVAQKLKIKTKVADGRVYYANGREVDRILFKKNAYTRQLADGTFEKFDKEGRLIQMNDRNGNFLKLSYKKKRLREIIDNNGRSLTFRYDANRKLKEILGPNGLTAKYKFEGVDNLKNVTNAWGNGYGYEYDNLHNLTKISYPDKTTRELTYDKKKDWVTSYKSRDNCEEKYGYELSKSNPRFHYWSTVKKFCNGKKVSDARYEFWYRRGQQQQVYLHRAATTLNNQVRDIVYHEVFGKPVTIQEGGIATHYAYYKNGLLKTKKAPGAELLYKYNRMNRLSEMQTKAVNAKGKTLKKLVTKFKYSKRGNLKWAENNEGQKVSLNYDTRGRIVKIKDQAQREVEIKYEEKFGKPAFVTRTGMGTIKISYDSRGGMKNVESQQGPIVAMQVATTFNNFLDIIGPAATELGIN